MPTDPKDNKGGDLAEIRDLQGRKVPKPTVTQRRNKWTKESDTQALARQAREDVGKTRLINDSRQQFQVKKVSNLKAKADFWASQEKADIDSGRKKAPLTSREKEMADKKYSDLAPSKRLSSNPPAAAQSRMDANKPLKTALVRDLAPGVSRDRTAANLRADRTSGVDKQLSLGDKHQRKFMSLMNAAETGEAQQFVGRMKPGVAERTEAHSIDTWAKRAEAHQDRQMSYPTEAGDTWGHTNKYVKDAPASERVSFGRSSKQGAIRQEIRGSNVPTPLSGNTASSSRPAKDLGEAVPGASKAQGLRTRAVARSVMENRSETTDAAAKKARTDKAFSEMSQEKAPNQSKVSAGGQRFAPRMTGDPRLPDTGQTKSNIARPNKDLGRITTRLIRESGTPSSTISEAGGGILKAAAMKARGQTPPKVRRPGKGGVAAGSAPRLTGVLDDSHDLTSVPGWSRKIRPGDL